MEKIKFFVNAKKLKIALMAIIVLIGFAFFGNKTVNANEATVTTDGNEITWIYSVVDGNAKLEQISKWNGLDLTDTTVSSTVHNVTIPTSIDGYTVTEVGSGSDPINQGKLKIGKVVFPVSVKAINSHAFEKCVELEEIVFESDTTLEAIGEYAFANDTNLKSMKSGTNPSESYCLRFPSSLKTIGNYAFEMNADYRHYQIYDNEVLPYARNAAGWSYYTSSVSDFLEIKLGNNITSIGDFAFAGCDFLNKVEIPATNENVTIGKAAFAYCSLSNLSFAQRQTTLTIDDFAFSYQKNINENLEIPENIVLGKRVFKNNNKLKNVTIGNIELDEYTFENNNALEEVTISNSVKVIPTCMFIGCESLEKITAPGVEVIEGAAFSDLTNLNDLQFGTLKYIGDYAFNNCQSITTNEFNQILPSTNKVALGKNVFSHCTGLTETITLNLSMNNVIENGVEYEASATGTFSNTNIKKAIITSDENLTKLPGSMFYSCSLLEDVDFPNTINNIGNSAFQKCPKITLNILEEKIIRNAEVIGWSAFADDEGIEGTLIIPETVTTIGSSAFENDTAITGELTLPQSVKTVESRAFYNTGITKVNYNTTIESIGTLALPNNNEIIRIPSTRLNTIFKNAYTNVREAFFEVENIEHLEEHWNGQDDVIIHYKNHKHTVKLYNSLPGVKLLNAQTNEEITSAEFPCESNVALKVEIEEGYSYPDLAVKVISGGQYASSSLTKEFVTLDSNGQFTMENLTRDKVIVLQKDENQTDLEVRQFITSINNLEVPTSRVPNIVTTRKVYNLDEIEYQHTKLPLFVAKGDVIKYKVRVYNEGDVTGKVNELKVYLQDGLELAENNTVNWTVESTTDKGSIIKTDYLKNKEIAAYRGEGRPEYEDVELICKVTKEEKNLITAIAELSDSNDVDSIPNNISLDIIEDYKQDESYASSTTSYIKSEQDDTDYESVAIKNVYRVGYKIALEKIDSTNSELLNGAKFNLYNEDKELIESKVTVNNGKLVFDEQITYGEGTDTYYIEEVETPAGYKKTIDGMMELTVRKYVNSQGNISLEIICDVDERFDFNDDDFYIPITNVDDLKKIGTGEAVVINGETHLCTENAFYELKNDIDLAGEEWTPIPRFSGVLEGNGHKIKNLTIHKQIDYSSSETYCLGLFAQYGGYVRNVTLENVDINPVINGGESSGYTNFRVGAFAGYTFGNSIFENCTVSGNIDTIVTNVGGFVGHTAEGPDVKFKNCINNANVTGKENIGGLVGCAKGDTDIVKCTNNGKIKGLESSYNAGGLVGAAIPVGSTPENIIVGYDETTATITIAVKNKKTVVGEYNLLLEKVDMKEKIYLDGAKFNIYDEEMNLLQENAETRDGKIKISDIVINSLQTDVFYLKEVQAPEGYDIRVNDLVKVVIAKRWNSQEERYEIDVTPSIVSGITETPENNNIHAETGATSDVQNSEFVRYTSTRLKVSDSINNGEIDSVMYAGGMIGSLFGQADINNCKNLGKVSGKCISGGIISQIAYHPGATARIRNSCNGAEDDEENQKGILLVDTGGSNNTLGGIVGCSYTNLDIINCTNYSDITLTVSPHIGGIIGQSFARNLKVVDSANYGNIMSDGTRGGQIGVGGIVGSFHGVHVLSDVWQLNVLGKTISNNGPVGIDVNNCIFTGNIMMPDGQIGGIVGLARTSEDGEKITITKCEVGNASETTNISHNTSGYYGVGGLIGAGIAANINITDNNVNNVNITAEDYVGGLAGVFNTEIYTYTVNTNTSHWTVKPKIRSLTVANNNVSNANITGRYAAAGLIGEVTSGNDAMHNESSVYGNATITYNNVYNSNLLSTNNTQSSVAGIIGFSSAGLSVTIANCNIINTDFEVGTAGNGNLHSAGIIGMSNVYSLTIANCEVKSTDNEKHYIKLSANNNKCSLGGMVAYLWNGNPTQIANCKISQMKIQKTCQHPIGDGIGGVIGQADSCFSINDVKVDNVDIIETESDPNGNGLQAIGGFVGCIYYSGNNNSQINGSKFTNSKIIVDGESSVGGFCGVNISGKTTEINGAELSNIQIKVNESEYSRQSTTSQSGSSIGGFVGLGSTKIQGGNVNGLDISIKNSGAASVGGLVGCAGSGISSNVPITGVNIKNLKMDCGLSYWGITPKSVGGLIGTGTGQIKATTIDDIEIKASNAHVGGFVACGYNNTIEQNCSLKNATIEAIDEQTASGYLKAAGGFVGVGNAVIKTADVDNVNIKANRAHIGGFVGFGSTIDIEGSCNLKNAALEVVGEPVRVNYDVRCVGGLVAASDSKVTVTPNVENLEIKVPFGLSTDQYSGQDIHSGGVVGYALELSAMGGTIKNAKITNNALTGAVGGVAGVAFKGQIIGTKVSDFIANGNYRIGGIIGVGGIGGSMEVTGVTVTNMDTLDDTFTPNEYGNTSQTRLTDMMVGGIAGVLIDYNHPIKNATVTIDDDKIHTLKSKFVVGGLAAFSYGGIDSSTVENITVQSDGDATSTTDTSGEVASLIPNADSVMGRGFSTTINSIVRSVTVIRMINGVQETNVVNY